MRIAVVQDTNGLWFVRRLAYSNDDRTRGEMIYHCDKHLAGPFDEPIDAARWVTDNIADTDNDHSN